MMAPPPAAPSVSPFVPNPGVPPPVAARPPPRPRPAPSRASPGAAVPPRAAAPPRPRPAAHRSTRHAPGARRPQPWRPSAVFEHLPAVPPFARIHPETVALGDVRALHALARQGAWRAVLEKTRAALAGPGAGSEPSRAAPAVASPAWLALKTYHVLALTKLRTFGGAADELRQLGNLDDPRYNTAPDGSSAVPHALRILAAELPGLLGRPRETADALYALADRCAEETSRAARLAASDPAVASSNPSSGEGGDEGIWRRRRDAAMHAAVNAHVSEGEHLAALARLDWMARCRPANDPDPGIFSLAGRVHLQLGDVEGAEMCFDAARDAASAAASAAAAADARRIAAEISARCETDAGLLAVARKDHAGARRLFEAALAARPWDAVAANNLAVTHMYTRDLRGGVRVLEESLTCHPAAAAQRECLMRNACSMYEIAAATPAAAKRALAAWTAHVAPEDLDPACTRL